MTTVFILIMFFITIFAAMLATLQIRIEDLQNKYLDSAKAKYLIKKMQYLKLIPCLGLAITLVYAIMVFMGLI